MLQAIDINQRVKFVSRFDNSEPKTEFILKPLSGGDSLTIGAGGGENSIISMVAASIVEIKNFKGSDDTTEIVKSLSLNVLNELLEKVNSLNNVTEEDEKN